MYIRQTQTKNKKTGKVYSKYSLVASRLTEKGPRQHTIMQLGTLDLSKIDLKILANMLEHRLAGQEPLFMMEEYPQLETIADDAMKNYRFVKTKQKEIFQDEGTKDDQVLITINENSLQVSKARSLGPALIGNEYWKRLGFDNILKKQGFSKRERCLLQAIIIGRLVEPGSELSTWNWFRENTALPELLEEDISTLNKNPFYEISDKLWTFKSAIEKELWVNQKSLFNLSPTIFLYDLTNTYFEGICEKNPLAQRGISKEKRKDCRLVSLALVVDSQGTPVYSRIYKGNQSEPETLDSILDEVYDVDRLDGDLKPTIIMDRGIATSKNIQSIKDKGFPYAVVERTKHEKEYIDLFTACPNGFDEWQDSKGQRVHLKKLTTDSDEVRVLVKSEQRIKKEKAMDALQKERLLEKLDKIKASIHKGKPKETGHIHERIGRAKNSHQSVAKYYNIKVNSKEGLVTDMTWSLTESAITNEDLLGAYVISTDQKSLDAKDIWELYMTLTKVEGAFRDLKSNLGLRPVHHQKEERVCAHIQIAVFAYHIMSAIEKDMNSAGIRSSWKSIKKSMTSLQQVTINYTDEKKQLHELRKSTVPESKHLEILSALRINLPSLKKKSIVGKMTTK